MPRLCDRNISPLIGDHEAGRVQARGSQTRPSDMEAKLRNGKCLLWPLNGYLTRTIPSEDVGALPEQPFPPDSTPWCTNNTKHPTQPNMARQNKGWAFLRLPIVPDLVDHQGHEHHHDPQTNQLQHEGRHRRSP